MLPTEKRNHLYALGWLPAKDSVSGNVLDGHRIDGKTCCWYDGKINGAERSAWIAADGTVMLHGGPDMAFDEFIELLTKPPAKPQRGLFDGDELEEQNRKDR